MNDTKTTKRNVSWWRWIIIVFAALSLAGHLTNTEGLASSGGESANQDRADYLWDQVLIDEDQPLTEILRTYTHTYGTAEGVWIEGSNECWVTVGLNFTEFDYSSGRIAGEDPGGALISLDVGISGYNPSSADHVWLLADGQEVYPRSQPVIWDLDFGTHPGEGFNSYCAWGIYMDIDALQEIGSAEELVLIIGRDFSEAATECRLTEDCIRMFTEMAEFYCLLYPEMCNQETSGHDYLWRQIVADEDPGLQCTFYHHRHYWSEDLIHTTLTGTGGYRISVDPYIVDSEMSGLTTRLYIGYFGDDWIFMDQVWLLVDGERIYLDFETWDVDSDVYGGGSVYEAVDEVVNISMFEEIGNAEDVILVISGDHGRRTECELLGPQLDMFREMTDFYNLLTDNDS